MRSIQARRDDPEHFFATRGEISAEDLNTASDGIVTYLFLKTLCHIVHFLTNSPVACYKYLNKPLSNRDSVLAVVCNSRRHKH